MGSSDRSLIGQSVYWLKSGRHLGSQLCELMQGFRWQVFLKSGQVSPVYFSYLDGICCSYLQCSLLNTLLTGAALLFRWVCATLAQLKALFRTSFSHPLRCSITASPAMCEGVVGWMMPPTPSRQITNEVVQPEIYFGGFCTPPGK